MLSSRWSKISLWSAVVILALIAATFLASSAAQWWFMASAQGIRLFTISVIALILIAIVGKVAGHFSSPSGGANPAARGGWLRSAFLILPAISASVGGEVCTNLAASIIHDRASTFFDEKKGYVNHDIAKLVGGTLRIMTLGAAKDDACDGSESSLRQIAGVIPQKWFDLSENRDPRINPLTESNLWRYIQNPGEATLPIPQWLALIDEWTLAAKAKPLPPNCRSGLAKKYADTFAFSFREALKNDSLHSGKASAAMQLDLFGELLRRSTENASTTDPDVRNELSDLLQTSETMREALAARIREEAESLRQGLDTHSTRVLAEFEQSRSEWRQFLERFEAEAVAQGEERERARAERLAQGEERARASEERENARQRHETLLANIREHMPNTSNLTPEDKLAQQQRLIEAVKNDNAATVSALVDLSPDVLVAPNQETLLHVAARSNALEALRVLLSAGIKVDTASKDNGRTALHIACAKGNLDMAQALLDAGANPAQRTTRGDTALHLAAGDELSASVLALLLERGMDVNTPNSINQQTPLHAAARAHAWRCMDILLAHPGSGVDARDGIGDTPLLTLSRAAGGRDDTPVCEGIRKLLAHGAERSATDAKGRTAGEIAAAANREILVRCLADAP